MSRNLIIRQATQLAIDLAKTTNQSATSFTVHCSTSIYRSALNSGDPISYLCKNLKRHLRKNGVDPAHLWFSLELVLKDGVRKRPHLHGLIIVPNDKVSALKSALTSCLGGVTKVQSIARKRHVQETYSLGWSSYCMKVTEKIAGLIGRGSTYISRGFSRLIREKFGKTPKAKKPIKPVAIMGLGRIFKKGSVINWGNGFLSKTAHKSNHPLHKPLETKEQKLKQHYEDLLMKQMEEILNAPDNISREELDKEIQKCSENEPVSIKTESVWRPTLKLPASRCSTQKKEA